MMIGRVVVLLLVAGVLVYVAHRIWVAVLQLRVGAIPEGVEIPEVQMEADRGWQVTREVQGDVVRVRVEHPAEGVANEWELNIRTPGASRELERIMRIAGGMVTDLSLG